jgi:hypothetical protein
MTATPHPMPTLEEAQAFYARAKAVLATDPAARAFEDLRAKWSRVYGRKEKLLEKLNAITAKERAMFDQVLEAKTKLSPEAREALC